MRNHLGYRVRRRFSAAGWLLLVTIMVLGLALLWLVAVPTKATSDTVAPEAADFDVTWLALALCLLVSVAVHVASGRRLLPWRARR